MPAQVILHDPSAVALCKAACKAADTLRIGPSEFAAILGLNTVELGRCRSEGVIDPESEVGRRATELVRCASGLSALFGLNSQAIQTFLYNPNKVAKGRPIELMKAENGARDIANFVERMRRLS